MNTYLDCIPCFFRQILEGARIADANPEAQKQIVNEFARHIPKISLESSPPEIARIGYRLLKKISPDGDPYKKIKQKSNRLALRLYPKLKHRMLHSDDPLLYAVELAIAGNVIDFGVKNKLNVDTELKKILAEEDKCILKKSLFHYSEFKLALKKAGNILYLADNAGETVFDRILIEEIKRLYPKKIIYYAVKEKPIINDALTEDAEECKIHRIAQVISNGTDAPGTILSLCSREFRKIYSGSDMIISKGQGNYESLSSAEEPIFFLFMVKCPVVARDTACRMGDAVLLCNFKETGKRSRLKEKQK